MQPRELQLELARVLVAAGMEPDQPAADSDRRSRAEDNIRLVRVGTVGSRAEADSWDSSSGSHWAHTDNLDKRSVAEALKAGELEH